MKQILRILSLKNINTKYRVLLGPFNDIKKLEESFNEIKSLNFENIRNFKRCLRNYFYIFVKFFILN